MKKAIIILAIASSGVPFAHAQRSLSSELPERLFIKGKEMYLNQNYVGCIDMLEQYKKQSKDAKQLPEVEYLILSSWYNQGKPGVDDLLKDYLDTYPETLYRQEIYFYIGSIHFNQGEWAKALFWFNQADIDYLSMSEQEDYAFRTAVSLLKNGQWKESRPTFELLSKNSDKYNVPASYYLAYIDFHNGDYGPALETFRILNNKPEYKEATSLFLIQGAFIQGRKDEAISRGLDYIRTYPNGEDIGEVFRILGNCYYQNENAEKALYYYQEYLKAAANPVRQDMYILGELYYNLEDYDQAINVLKLVASTTDRVGQAAYLLLGQAYLKTDETANAMMAFDAASRVSYDESISEKALYNYVLLVNRSNVSVFDGSIKATQRFLQEHPNSKYTNEINKVLANNLLMSKDYDAALKAINSMNSKDKEILAAKQIILFQLGTQKFIDGDYNKAKDDLNACINLGNYNTTTKGEAYFWLGEIAYREGNYKQAIKDYTNYTNQTTTKTNYPEVIYNLGYAYYETKEYNQALTNFKKYVVAEKDQQLPSYADALNRIGDCYLFNRNYAESERYYAQAIDANPAGADYAEYQKAFVKGMQRDYASKVRILDNLMATYPNSGYYDDALYEKARALTMMNKEADAIPVLEKLLKQFPRSMYAAQSGVLLGQIYYNQNNSPKSIETYKKVVSSYPNTEEARISVQALESVYKDINDISSYAAYVNSLGKGMSLSSVRQDSLTYLAAENIYMKGRKAEAKTALNKYLQSYPSGIFSSDAHFYIGSIDFDSKDYNSALSHFNNVIKANNRKYIDDALIYSSGIEFDNKNYTSAYKIYSQLDEVASNTENHNTAQLGMLRCSYLLKNDEEVIEAANKLLANKKLASDVANEAQFYRGKSLLNKKKSDDAIKDFTAVGKEPRNAFGAESQYILANIYYQNKSYDKAEKQVLDFMKKGTPHQYWMARAVIVLADTYTAKGDNFQAKQYLESLKANYGGTEKDIADMISQRLAKIK